MNDNEAFPSLGAPSAKDKVPPPQSPARNWGVISGAKAAAVLEEVRKKKDEREAETTATGAAKAVLGDE